MTRFKLVFSEAVRSIAANLSTSIAATMTVLIGMFLLGLFIALGTWVLSWSDHVKKGLQVKVYFAAGTTILMVTHDREMVDKMRKRVIALDQGKLMRDERRGGYETE